jgi:hypothetical protein
MSELTQDAAIAWLLKAPELTEDRAIEIMLDVCARLYGLSLDQQARVIATIAAFVVIEAADPAGAIEDFTAMVRRQVEVVR